MKIFSCSILAVKKLGINTLVQEIEKKRNVKTQIKQHNYFEQHLGMVKDLIEEAIKWSLYCL